MTDARKITDSVNLAIADVDLRSDVYRLRHDVYSTELNQYPIHFDGRLCDDHQVQSVFIAATFNKTLMGFVGVTPPTSPRFSLDKHVPRDTWADGLAGPWFEIRTLTVARAFRRFRLAGTLMYAAFRYVEAHGGNAIISMGRREVIDLYLRFGFRPAGVASQCGDVTYDLMSANIKELSGKLFRYQPQLLRMQQGVDWQLPFAFASR